MTPASKILPFRKRDREVATDATDDSVEDYPRFRKEEATGHVPANGPVAGVAIPPYRGK